MATIAPAAHQIRCRTPTPIHRGEPALRDPSPACRSACIHGRMSTAIPPCAYCVDPPPGRSRVEPYTSPYIANGPATWRDRQVVG